MTKHVHRAAPAPAAGGEEARSVGPGGPGEEEDEEPRDTDPHPDTPDDFDEDASVPRQSEEAIPGDEN
jgi:hypothetical protein